MGFGGGTGVLAFRGAVVLAVSGTDVLADFGTHALAAPSPAGLRRGLDVGRDRWLATVRIRSASNAAALLMAKYIHALFFSFITFYVSAIFALLVPIRHTAL